MQGDKDKRSSIAWYAASTIVLLYIANLSDEELPADRVGRLLGYMFVVTTAGGLLGTFAPHLHLTSPLELLLHTNNTFLLDAIHPKTADVATTTRIEPSRKNRSTCNRSAEPTPAW